MPTATRPEREVPELEDIHLARRLAAELVGTFLLTFVAAGAEMMAVKAPLDVGATTRAVAPGLVVLAMIYAVSDVSGAHFNPAVTLGFALRGDFRWSHVPAYVATQTIGSTLAAVVLRAMLGDVAHLGVTSPELGTGDALTAEVVLTAGLLTVILGTASRKGAVGPNAALAVGATIAFSGLVFGPFGGPSMNPARSLGPALVSGHLHDVWIYLVGPLLGMVLAVGIAWAVHGRPHQDEQAAAEGDDD